MGLEGTLVVGGVLLVFIFIIVASAIRIVPEYQRLVVLRLGRAGEAAAQEREEGGCREGGKRAAMSHRCPLSRAGRYSGSFMDCWAWSTNGWRRRVNSRGMTNLVDSPSPMLLRASRY